MTSPTLTERTMQRRRNASPEVARLVSRIRTLVAQRRALERRGRDQRLEAMRREIEHLQWRLAEVVRRELSEPGRK